MIKTDKNTTSSYPRYKEKVEEPLSVKDYLSLIELYNSFIVDLFIEGEKVSLPCRMGVMYIGGTIRKKSFDEEGRPLLPPDWVKTKALRERSEKARKERTIVRHTNDETGGVSYKLIWSKNRSPVKNKNFISFRLTRSNKRKISEAILSGKEYIITKTIE
jgi:hypothetical protein